MKNENLALETSANEMPEVVNTDELITDFSYQYKMFQLNFKLDMDDENDVVSLES
jgi:hypothetical protein